MILSRLAFFIAIGMSIGCTPAAPTLHLADLPKAELTSDQITLLEESSTGALADGGSTDPSHGVIPPHRTKARSRVNWLVEGPCARVQSIEICGAGAKFNTEFTMSAKRSDGSESSMRFQASIAEIFASLLVLSSANVFATVDFAPGKIGLLHSYGFSLLRHGKFCDAIGTNPNQRVRYGLSSSEQLLLFSAGPATSVDRAVDGWRVYDEAKLCH